MPNGLLGMDHQAIVWCHGVLDVVRKVIWTLAISEGADTTERSTRVRRLLGQDSDSYQEQVDELMLDFQVSFTPNNFVAFAI